MTPDGSLALAGVSPDVLAGVGRDLCRFGESVYMIDVNENGVRLLPASSWSISGGVSPDRWSYALEFALPSGPVGSILTIPESTNPTEGEDAADPNGGRSDGDRGGEGRAGFG